MTTVPPSHGTKFASGCPASLVVFPASPLLLPPSVLVLPPSTKFPPSDVVLPPSEFVFAASALLLEPASSVPLFPQSQPLTRDRNTAKDQPTTLLIRIR